MQGQLLVVMHVLVVYAVVYMCVFVILMLESLASLCFNVVAVGDVLMLYPQGQTCGFSFLFPASLSCA
jgi:hypothetical protein